MTYEINENKIEFNFSKKKNTLDFNFNKDLEYYISIIELTQKPCLIFLYMFQKKI